MDWFILLMIVITGIFYVVAPVVLVVMTPFVIYELIIDIVNLWHDYKLERKTERRR